MLWPVGVETFGVVVVAAWVGAMGPGMRHSCLLALLVKLWLLLLLVLLVSKLFGLLVLVL